MLVLNRRMLQFIISAFSFLLSAFTFPFSVCLIHPLRFARPPVSEGQFAGAVIDFSFQFVTNSPPETGASTPKGGGGGYKFSVFTFHLSVFTFHLSDFRLPFVTAISPTGACSFLSLSGSVPSCIRYLSHAYRSAPQCLRYTFRNCILCPHRER